MATPDAGELLFVYGTLRPGGRYWQEFLAGRDLPMSAPTRVADLVLLAGPGYPLAVRRHDLAGAGLLAPDSAAGVVGEVITVPGGASNELLDDLDALEGVPELFTRECIDGLWVYLATPATVANLGGEILTHGDWLLTDDPSRDAWEQVRDCPYGPLPSS
jgi:gamma-glutamylcyclotransferase (GGCT)/AIG2-like uncharacterized protein YtfP